MEVRGVWSYPPHMVTWLLGGKKAWEMTPIIFYYSITSHSNNVIQDNAKYVMILPRVKPQARDLSYHLHIIFLQFKIMNTSGMQEKQGNTLSNAHYACIFFVWFHESGLYPLYLGQIWDNLALRPDERSLIFSLHSLVE